MSRRFSRTRILSLTLAPPINAARGLAGDCKALPNCSTSRWTRSPIAEGKAAVMPTVEAWARWATANASITKQSASLPSPATKPGSFFSSPAWNLRFSRRTTWRGFMESISASISGPIQSLRLFTGCSSSSARRFPTVPSLSPSTTFPPGRPR